LGIFAQAIQLLGKSMKCGTTGISCDVTALMGVQKIFTRGFPNHISRLRCPMGLPTARQLYVELSVGGPLSCTSIIARWG
jgi:hypothetical protein